MTTIVKIGKWSFAPDTGMIENETGTQRLEHRAAALLELLARSPGEVISQTEIIDQVWDGRTVSPNSVAVVISDIRRALGDDPKAPSILETLPKRGYRLIADVSHPEAVNETPHTSANETPIDRTSWRWLAVTILALIVLFAFAVRVTNPTPVVPLPVTIEATTNETGADGYDPLTRSVTELVVMELSGHAGFQIVTDGDPQIRVRSKLILWDGHPSMSITAEDVQSGDVIWSGMASGPETLLPRQVRAEMSEFADLMESEDASN